MEEEVNRMRDYTVAAVVLLLLILSPFMAYLSPLTWIETAGEQNCGICDNQTGDFVDPGGFIYDALNFSRISNARVWLQHSDGFGGWTNVSTSQVQPSVNPQVSNDRAIYA
jgi:hypothetical protein